MSTLQRVLVNEIGKIVHAEVKGVLKDLKKKVADQALEIKALTAAIKALGGAIQAPPAKPKAAALNLDLTPERQDLAAKYDKNTLVDLVRKTGLTQRQLAILFDTSLVSISKWMSTKALPRDAMKAAIVEVANLDKADIIARLPEDARENRRSRHQKTVHRRAVAKAAKTRKRNAQKDGKIRKARVKKVPSTASISADDAAKAVANLMTAPVSE